MGITAEDVYEWEVATSSMQASKDTCSRLRAEMQRTDTEAEKAEQLCVEAHAAMQAMSDRVAASAEAETRAQKAHEDSIHAMTTATAAALTSARDAARRAEEDTQKAIAARCERLV